MPVFSTIYPPVMRLFNALGIDSWRRQLGASVAAGDVLEVGCGPGFERRFLPSDARVHAIEPDAAMRRTALAGGGYVEVLDEVAEALPFTDDRFDQVVISMVLCTVAEPQVALREVHRVLAPGGTLHLFEHVRATNRWLLVLQRVLRRPWSMLGGGCDLCRDPLVALAATGFDATVERRGFGGALLLVRAVARDLR
jgi:ubiquinone/menaquinone biosynthesis C-methylase UbiE